MKKRSITTVILILLIEIFANKIFAQGENYSWCFGDSAYVKYSSGAMVTQSYSLAESMEANASISDKNGNLLFYTSGLSQGGFYLKVYDRNNQLMPNGDSLFCWVSSTNGVLIVPFPGDSSKFYLFTNNRINPSPNYFLYEHIINLALNGGNGDLIQKNLLFLR